MRKKYILLILSSISFIAFILISLNSCRARSKQENQSEVKRTSTGRIPTRTWQCVSSSSALSKAKINYFENSKYLEMLYIEVYLTNFSLSQPWVGRNLQIIPCKLIEPNLLEQNICLNYPSPSKQFKWQPDGTTIEVEESDIEYLIPQNFINTTEPLHIDIYYHINTVHQGILSGNTSLTCNLE